MATLSRHLEQVTPSFAGNHQRNLGRLPPANIYRLLSYRSLHEGSFCPLIGIYLSRIDLYIYIYIIQPYFNIAQTTQNLLQCAIGCQTYNIHCTQNCVGIYPNLGKYRLVPLHASRPKNKLLHQMTSTLHCFLLFLHFANNDSNIISLSTQKNKSCFIGHFGKRTGFVFVHRKFHRSLSYTMCQYTGRLSRF